MNLRPINKPGSCKPNLSRIDRTLTQWVEPRPSSEAVLDGARSKRSHRTPNTTEQVGIRRKDGTGEGPGTPAQVRGRNAERTGRHGRPPCPASTDGLLLPTPPCSGLAPAGTTSQTTTRTIAAGLRRPRRETTAPRRLPRPRRWSCATGWMSRAWPCALHRSSPPSACSSGNPRPWRRSPRLQSTALRRWPLAAASSHPA